MDIPIFREILLDPEDDSQRRSWIWNKVRNIINNTFGPCLGKNIDYMMFRDQLYITYEYHNRPLQEGRNDWLDEKLTVLLKQVTSASHKLYKELLRFSLEYSEYHPGGLLELSNVTIFPEVNYSAGKLRIDLEVCMNYTLYESFPDVPVVQQYLWNSIRLGKIHEVRWLLRHGAHPDMRSVELARQYRKPDSSGKDKMSRFLRKQERKDRRAIYRLLTRRIARSNLLTQEVFRSMQTEIIPDVVTLVTNIMNE